MQVDPVIARSPISVGADGQALAVLPRLAAGRPLVIDYYASHHRGVTVGDVTVAFRTELSEPRYVDIEPIAGVRVLVERHLIPLLAEGATLRWHRRLLRGSLGVSLRRPESWIDFLDSHPAHR